MKVSTASWLGANYEVITLSDKVVPDDDCNGCFVCQKGQAGNELLKLELQKCCRECFEKVFGERCLRCQGLICGETQMSFIYYNNKFWHKNCFRCNCCGTSLLDRHFLQDNSRIYCSQCGAC